MGNEGFMTKIFLLGIPQEVTSYVITGRITHLLAIKAVMASRGVENASTGCRLVRDLPFQTLNRLAAILDLYDGGRAGWEQVIAQMPKGTYDNIQVGTFRLSQMRLGGSPSYDLLTDMGYRGRTVEQLISYLEKVENEKALELLKPPEAPRMVKQPTVGIAPEDSEIQLECLAIALPFPQYRWFRGKQAVDDIPGEIHGSNDRRLTFKQAKPHHNGQYCCRAMNKMGHVFSNWVEVRIIPNPAPLANRVGPRNPIPASVEVRRQASGAPRITQHPSSTSVQEGGQCWLACEARGDEPLQYRWYKNGVEMPNRQGMRILFQPVHVADAGQYLCKVSNAAGDDVSNSAHLQVVCSPQEGRGPTVRVPELVISEKHLGRDVTMTVAIDTPNVIWFKDDNIIEGGHGGKKYQLKQVESQHFGRYNCKSISGSSLSLREIEISVVPPLEPAVVGSCRGKVALLIGNQKYLSAELTKLRQPHNDVQALAGQLTSLGFHCVTLIDASKKEMEQALEFFEYLLVTGVHALFYFAGHGFEENGENYLVPVDVHEGFSLLECIKAQYILRIMQDRDTALNFLILDMCRKGRDDTSSSQQSCPQPLHNRANTIISYACNPQYDAYESKSIASDNGIFMAQFLKHIGEVKRVEDLLMTVNAAVYKARPEAVPEEKWQKPTFISSLAHPISLHDRIVHIDEQYPSDNQFMESMRLWKLAHTIPPPIVVDDRFIHDGVEVTLTFQSEFSNVLLIQVNVIHPAAVSDVRVSLSASGTAKQTNYHVMDLQNQGISTMSSERSISSSSSGTSSLSSQTSCITSRSSQMTGPPFQFKIERLQRIRGDVIILLNLQYTCTEKGVPRSVAYHTRTRIEPPLIARIYQHRKD